MPRVLITGAAGFIGMHTSIRFLKEGWDVIGLDNLNDYYSVSLKEDRLKEIKKSSVEFDKEFLFYQEDLNSDIWDQFEDFKIDSLVHLAAQAGVRYSIENPGAYLQSNILGFQKVIEFVLKKKIDRFLYASSSSVYGKNSKQPFSESEPCNSPESYYAATKRANELMAHSYSKTQGLKSIGLRFFTVYGPWGRPDMAPMLFAHAAFKKNTIEVFNYGKQKRDFTYVDDIIEGIYTLVIKDNYESDYLLLNIGNGSPVGLLDFISTIEKYSCPINKKMVAAQNGDVEVTYADTSLLSKNVGYISKYNLETGIQIFMKWFKNYHNYE
jgi:UDP-glucuronate 4-epimerase